MNPQETNFAHRDGAARWREQSFKSSILKTPPRSLSVVLVPVGPGGEKMVHLLVPVHKKRGVRDANAHHQPTPPSHLSLVTACPVRHSEPDTISEGSADRRGGDPGINRQAVGRVCFLDGCSARVIFYGER